MPACYQNRCIDIDLRKSKYEIYEPDTEKISKFLGGKGLGLALLCELDESKDPLDGKNPLMFLTGPLTGTSISTSNRSCVVTRSPLTGGFLDSHAGGHFGTALKRAGYDYVLIKGKASSPVYIHLTPKGADILDAQKLWAKGCIQTEKSLKQKHKESRVASIGLAGENLVRFACITTELYRQYGRGGAGAVMGSKNLKALVVEGSEPVNYHDAEKFRELTRTLTKDLMAHPNRKRRYDLGTVMWIRMGQEIGHFLPTRNFKKGQFPEYEKLTSETMKKELAWKSCGCYNCIIQCSKMAKWNGNEFEGPEYETTAYLGSGCEIGDAKKVAEANILCDDLGLDTISTGVTISFAMEAAEKGLLPKEENIKFGDAGSLLETINKIAHRQGIGDLLAEGTRIASKKLGKGSDYFAIQIAGMELSGVNPLGSYSMALSLATSDFASHTRFWSATDEMTGDLKLETLPKYIAEGQDEINARNSMIICDFLPFGLDRLARFIEAGTGEKSSKESLMKIGERIHTLARLYNLKTGRTHKDDILPARFHEEESFAGLMKGKKIPRKFFESQLQEYFALRGWDGQGRPTRETVERLGLKRFRKV
jgi:aldehyde:ferredoxin oxidoreductase